METWKAPRCPTCSPQACLPGVPAAPLLGPPWPGFAVRPLRRPVLSRLRAWSPTPQGQHPPLHCRISLGPREVLFAELSVPMRPVCSLG